MSSVEIRTRRRTEGVLKDLQMQTVTRDQLSEWGDVSSGAPQGSVLLAAMFLTGINNVAERVRSYTIFFADDLHINRRLHSVDT